MRDRDELDPLAQEIDTYLRALAPPRAPSSLLPRVLAATTLRPSAPWYAQRWQAWSPDLRVAAALIGVLAVVNLIWLAGAIGTSGWVDGLAIDAVPAMWQPFVTRASAVMSLVSAVWESLGAPLTAALAPVVIAFGVACAGCGLALRQLVPGGTSRS